MRYFRIIHWQPLAVVAVISCILFATFNIVRIPEHIDMLYPRSILHINDFHAREYAVREPIVSLPYAQVSDTEARATIGTNPESVRVIEFDVDQKPDSIHRRLMALFVDDNRILEVNDRGKQTTYGVIIPPSIVFDENSVIRVVTIPDDKIIPPPFEVKAIRVSDTVIFRWSQAQSQLHFHGVAGGWWSVTAHAYPSHPDEKPFEARIRVGDRDLGLIPHNVISFRKYSYLVPPSAVDKGDIHVTINSQTWANNTDELRSIGIAVADVSVRPLTTPWWNIGLSARIATMIAIAIVAAISAQLVGVSAISIGTIVAVVLSIVMLFNRSYLAEWYPQLLLLMSIGLISIPLWYRILDWLAGESPFSERTKQLLVGVVLLSIWVKGGGILYPIMRPIDIEWHMDKVREILTTWDIAKFYLPGAFSESVMPITEWGEERPMIPYSPFYHLFSLIYAIFPWSLEKTATIFNAFLDASRVIIIAVIFRRIGMSERVSWLAAVGYAIAPVTFLLHAWGNAPTTTGLWWTLVTTAVLLIVGKSINDRKIFWSILALTTMTMLIYTVTAVFHVLFVSVLALFLWIMPTNKDKSTIKPILMATYGGLGIATLLYYGQYIPPIIERTIPYFLQISVASPASVGVERPPWGEYFWAYFPTLRYDFIDNPYLYYGIFIPMLMVIPGVAFLRKRQPLWAYMAAMFVIALLFMVAGYRISMVDKQIFYILPIVMLCWAVMADKFWRRGIAAQLMISIIMLFTTYSAMYLWIVRIDRAPVVLP
ncbi:MAG: hypothetical protein ACO3F2_06915 [Roseiflexaceae bacterium]